MPRSKPIPPQLLHKASQGDVDSIRRLGALLEPRNSTPEILDVVFKCLAAHPVPIISTATSRFILKTVVGARPGAYLGALWAIVDAGGDMNAEVKEALVEHLLESGDVVIGWMRVCLQNDLPCVPADRFKGQPSRRDSYLFQARMLTLLLHYAGDYANAMLSSAAFMDLFLELWLAEDRRDRDGGIYRMLDTTSMFPCETITLADKILTNDNAKELFLSKCSSAEDCAEFALAFVDRLKRGWDHAKVPIVGWSLTLNQMTEISSQLCKASKRFRLSLTRIGALAELSHLFKEVSEAITNSEEVRFLYMRHIPHLWMLIQVALGDNTSSRILRNWNQLKSGGVVEAALGVTPLLGIEDSAKEVDTMILILRTLGQTMTHPRTFGDWQFPMLTLESIDRIPSLAHAWTLLREAHHRSTRAYEVLKQRSSVYFCDYLPCALSGKDICDVPKQCAGCFSVVYCSPVCQMQDWEERHRDECRHARSFYDERRGSHTRYDHITRAEQAALLEVIYENKPGLESYDITTHYPVFDSRFTNDLRVASRLESTGDGAYWEYPMHQPYLLPRLNCLIETYQTTGIPSDWRLVEGVFPLIDNGASINLPALLRAVDSRFQVVYCIPRYAEISPSITHSSSVDALGIV